MSAEEAVQLVKDGDVLAVDGIGGVCVPEGLLEALEKRFLETGRPCGLTLIGGGQGDARGRGLDRLAYEGLVKRTITPYVNLTRKFAKMIVEGKVEAYMIPVGVICQLYREIAGKRPGVITHIGLNSFIDPRVEGGKMNDITKEDLVEVVNLLGREWLLYKAVPVDVAFIKGTTADELGNVSMEREVAFYNALPMAMAAKNSGGKVVAQVDRVAAPRTLPPKLVKVPGILVDAVVVAKPESQMQTYRVQYNPAWSGEIRVSPMAIRPTPLDYSKIIGRRAAMELTPDAIVNIGAGMPEYVVSVAAEENLIERITLTVEHGPIGGIPAYGLNFGASSNPDAVIDTAYMVDYYDGGGLDVSFLGFAQVDRQGNVNASKFAGRITGVGGVLSVTQNTRKLVFCGAFTAGSDLQVENGRLKIVKEGTTKLVSRVEQVTFSGIQAAAKKQSVLYITERAVFQLAGEGVTLIEIAPGIDLEKDILGHMEFKPVVADGLKEMSEKLFKEERMNLTFTLGEKLQP